MLPPTAQTINEYLLYLIFFYALPSEHRDEDAHIDISTIEPMNFSMVCRSWRAAVLSNPSLWGHIQIKSYSDGRMLASSHHFLSKWLQYSQTSILSISLDLRRWDDEGDIENFNGLIDTTLAEHFRLEDLNITIRNPCTKRPFTLQLSPTLASLSLSFQTLSDDFLIPSKYAASLDFDCCTASAKIHTLYASQGVRWILPKHPRGPLRLPNLRDLLLCSDLNNNYDDFCAVLSACPCVEDLTVLARRCIPSSPNSASDRASSITDAVLLPHLTCLRVVSVNRPATVQLLGSLACPSLEALFVNTPERITASNMPEDHCMTSALLAAYSDFFNRSQPPLVVLSLLYNYVPSSYDGQGQALRSVLRPLRNLQSLELYGVVVDDELFEEMTFHDLKESGHSTICPLLKEFLLTYCDSDILTFDVKRKIVRDRIDSRRRTTVYDLGRVSLHLPDFLITDEYAFFVTTRIRFNSTCD